MAGAYAFGRRQFERSLRHDPAAARSAGRAERSTPRAIPASIASLLRDPMAALVDRELRVLGRAPRFRLLFLMGFTFGLVIWLPMLLRGEAPESLLTLVSAYALLLLGEVCFWNIFGMDRAAVQMWFASPVPLSHVMRAKNLAAACFIALEVTLVCLVCFLLRVPFTASRVLEAYCAVGVLAVFLFATGNMISVRYPRSLDPSQSWGRGGVGKVQAMLFLIYPVAGAPVLLAYAARYAFDADFALYAVLAIDAAIGAIVYRIASRWNLRCPRRMTGENG
jgi:ABC-2 type transport system permease protein